MNKAHRASEGFALQPHVVKGRSHLQIGDDFTAAWMAMDVAVA
jgi:hypothetical protein